VNTNVERNERKQTAIDKAVASRHRRHVQKIYEICRDLIEREQLGPSGFCKNCHRALTDEVSIRRGIGPECWQHVMRGIELLRDIRQQQSVIPVADDWKPRQWPSREDWAHICRDPHGHGWACPPHRNTPDPASTQLVDYASSKEIAAMIAALRKLWSAAGSEMVKAKKAHRDLFVHVGEDYYLYNDRYRVLSKAEQKIIEDYNTLRSNRAELQRDIERLEQNEIPHVVNRADVLAPLVELRSRYMAALAVSSAAWNEAIANTAVDDAAWERELAYRRKQDADAAADHARQLAWKRRQGEKMAWADRYVVEVEKTN
jgi:hypothetical protein